MEQGHTLGNLRVKSAMRRQIVCLEQVKSIRHGINTIIKHKINAILIVTSDHHPAGVVSKTDIMGAYYANLPVDTPLKEIMHSPPLFCRAEESLETALEQMRANRVYRLYVIDENSKELVGALAYPDIVGLLYQYCHRCPHSHLNRQHQSGKSDAILRFKVRDLMTPEVKSLPVHTTLTSVMEALSAYRFGAMLLTDSHAHPAGVISKTDLVLTYMHGVSSAVAADKVMSAPVHSCTADSLLEEAIKKMIMADIHRLFVHDGDEKTIAGVLSLSDAARGRSGSCHGCVSSRIRIDDHG